MALNLADLAALTGGGEEVMPDGGMMPPEDGQPEMPPELLEQMAAEDARARAQAFNDNLADDMDDASRTRLGKELERKIDGDRRASERHRKGIEQALKQLGVEIDPAARAGEDVPFEGAMTIRHPILLEAVLDFAAKAGAEIVPPTGPVKSRVRPGLPDADPELVEKANTIQEAFNDLLMREWPEFFPDTERTWPMVGLMGSAYRSVYFDPKLGRTTSRFVPADRVFVPYHATDLFTAGRITHRCEIDVHDAETNVARGYWSDVPILAERRSDDDDGIDERRAMISGREHADADEPETVEYDVCYTTLDPAEHGLPEDGEGHLPYVVTKLVTGKVLAIRRNWKLDDEAFAPRQRLIKYTFIEWDNINGLGLAHILSGIAEGTTAILRVLIDSGIVAAIPGGFRAKGVGEDDDVSYQPGEFPEIDLGAAQSMSDAFFKAPISEPSNVLFTLLGAMTDLGRRLASTTDLQVGDANNNAPVGSTIALLEQGAKVYKRIHARLHHSMQQEMAAIVDALRDEGHPIVDLLDADGDQVVDIIPVSDPNIFSQVQRIQQAQGLIQLMQALPDLNWAADEIARHTLTTLGVPEPDRWLPPEEEQEPPEPMDSATEHMTVLRGGPVMAYREQPHDAHLREHATFVATLRATAMPEVVEAVTAPLMAHMAEHIAFQVMIAAEIAVQQGDVEGASALFAQMAKGNLPPEPPAPEEADPIAAVERMAAVEKTKSDIAVNAAKTEQINAQAKQLEAMATKTGFETGKDIALTSMGGSPDPVERAGQIARSNDNPYQAKS